VGDSTGTEESASTEAQRSPFWIGSGSRDMRTRLRVSGRSEPLARGKAEFPVRDFSKRGGGFGVTDHKAKSIVDGCSLVEDGGEFSKDWLVQSVVSWLVEYTI
jgi:hypothetical protein